MSAFNPNALGTQPPTGDVQLYDVNAVRNTIPRALHAISAQSPLRFLRRGAQVGFELARASLLDRFAPQQGGVTEVSKGCCPSRGTSVALYLHWSPTGCISMMVRRQVAIWHDCGFDVVFISNADPPIEDWEAISEFVVLRIRRRNTGRDFGGWRDGAALALQHLPRPSELLLTNDSVLGPFRPMQPLVDAWRSGGDGLFGMTDSLGGGVHLQSYALLARGAAPVATTLDHLGTLRDSRSKWRLVQQGEIGLTRRMLREGHRCAALFGYDALCANVDDSTRIFLGPRFTASQPWRYPLNPTHHLWRVLIQKFGFPYLKTELVRHNPGRLPGVDAWIDLVSAEDAARIRHHLAVMARSPHANNAETDVARFLATAFRFR
jgi:hypothetical protein